MVTVYATRDTTASPEQVLDLVMDIERYAQIDDKIRPVLWSHRTRDRVVFGCRPTIAGLPGPTVAQYMDLTPGSRIDIGLLPSTANPVAGRIAHFEAEFVCEPIPGGTRIHRTLTFRFHPAVRWFADPWFRCRLQDEVEDELTRAVAELEAG